MGACDFYQRAKGKTSKDAFSNAVSDAQYEHGHGGYTGTIAEKHDFVMIKIPAGVLAGMDGTMVEKAQAYAEQLIQNCDPRINNKWGPAGCIDCGDDEYLFFGWASS